MSFPKTRHHPKADRYAQEDAINLPGSILKEMFFFHPLNYICRVCRHTQNVSQKLKLHGIHTHSVVMDMHVSDNSRPLAFPRKGKRWQKETCTQTAIWST